MTLFDMPVPSPDYCPCGSPLNGPPGPLCGQRSSHPPELDKAKSVAARDEGVTRAADAAAETWKATARGMLERFARTGVDRTPPHPDLGRAEIVSDDLWRAGLSRPNNDARALGAVFLSAARAGLIVNTRRVVPTDQVASHRSPMTVWRSLVLSD